MGGTNGGAGVHAPLFQSNASLELGVSAAQRTALVDLYNSCHNNIGWTPVNWLLGDPCGNSWQYVGCDESWDTILSLNFPVGDADNMRGGNSAPQSLSALTGLTSLQMAGVTGTSFGLGGSLPLLPALQYVVHNHVLVASAGDHGGGAGVAVGGRRAVAWGMSTFVPHPPPTVGLVMCHVRWGHRVLDLAWGSLDSYPEWLLTVSSLRSANITSNRIMNGSIPDTKLAATGLVSLRLGGGQLFGSLPSSLSTATGLE
jgi:hypothetical protein